ncbi:DNA-binding protein [Micromonospora sp. WMMD1082]|uniref:DNA-binding protein n=1 Tax=Micromonospora sp. WMMD1082 TaxID=3016104 RepID=UPI00241752D9|nr:DNA-binding protein [Micromonospora sp. WMMD1082]MDG4798431.1 DNA-binding protein [Micromonospora sp. WMMD1082]
MTAESFVAPEAAQARAHRTYTALQRLTERHAATGEQRHRHTNPYAAEPYEAIAVVLALAAGAAEAVPGEEPVDEADLLAALTLFPHLRAEIDTMEAGLLDLARSRGLTWQTIGHGLGLGSAQAARQRYDRLTTRTTPASP